PVEGVPEISLVSDDGGQTAITPNSYTRTTEELTILGKNFRDATALEIIDNNDAIIQLIYPVSNYIINDGMIVIPNGLIGYDAEGSARRIRVWNTLGRGEPSEEQFSILTGPPILTATTYDGLPFDRAEPLTLTGMGFKSRQINLNNAIVNYKDGNATLTHIIIETADGDNLDGNATGLGQDLRGSLTILSDTRAILAGDSLGAWADGAGRTIRVSRGTTQTVSSPSPTVFQLISTVPTVSTLTWINLADNNETDINSTSALRRDEAIWIRGVGLNSAIAVELVKENGGSYEPPFTAYFEAGDMDDNGTKLRLGKYAFNSSEADGFGTVRSKLKIHSVMASPASIFI
ncbi:MAG TPA: hypothetical protein QF373_06730, partial [Verrucomicrobiota bacterium]|nr:hypothetical protein [Verrucomicrobiota bacterium]